MIRAGGLLIVLSSCAASVSVSPLSVPSAVRAEAQRCQEENDVWACARAGESAITEPAYRAAGVTLLRRACERSVEQCDNALLKLTDAGLPQELEAMIGFVCPRHGAAVASCADAPARLELARMLGEAYATQDGFPVYQRWCERGSEEGCARAKLAKQSNEEKAKLEAARLELERRSREEKEKKEKLEREQYERERAAWIAKPFKERKAIRDAQCKTDKTLCFESELMTAGVDPLKMQPAAYAAAQNAFTQRVVDACVEVLTQGLTQLVFPMFEDMRRVCPASGLYGEKMDDVTVVLPRPFGPVKIFSCGGFKTVVSERPGETVIYNGVLQKMDVRQTTQGYECGLWNSEIARARRDFPIAIRPYCELNRGKAELSDVAKDLIRRRQSKVEPVYGYELKAECRGGVLPLLK